MNFKIVDGNRDYLNRKNEFVDLYNDQSITVPEIIKKLSISINEYKILREMCIEEDLIVLRKRGGNKKRSRRND